MVAAVSISPSSLLFFHAAKELGEIHHLRELPRGNWPGSLLAGPRKKTLSANQFRSSALNPTTQILAPLRTSSLDFWSRDIRHLDLPRSLAPPVHQTLPSGSGFSHKRAMQRRGDRVEARSSGFLTDEEEKTSASGAAVREMADRRGGGSGGGGGGGEGGGGDGDAVKWISSAIVLALWGGLILYSFTLAPNQTGYRDYYFVEKLLGLHKDDGFIMNQVLVNEWYIMGMWPIVYSLLLIPTGRTYKNSVPVWPFLAVSVGLGTFALLPYFALWRPPPPQVKRRELQKVHLRVLESKITAVVAVVAGLGIAASAGLAGADQWQEFLQYFRSSRFIHVMTIDFSALCVMAPFWVYNDLSVRQRSDAFSWFIPLAVIPYFGPALYLCFRPPLPAAIIDESD